MRRRKSHVLLFLCSSDLSSENASIHSRYIPVREKPAIREIKRESETISTQIILHFLRHISALFLCSLKYPSQPFFSTKVLFDDFWNSRKFENLIFYSSRKMINKFRASPILTILYHGSLNFFFIGFFLNCFWGTLLFEEKLIYWKIQKFFIIVVFFDIFFPISIDWSFLEVVERLKNSLAYWGV